MISKIYGNHEQLLYCKEPEILIEGPAGTGKTAAVMFKADLVCRKYPNARILFIRETRHSLSNSVLEIFETSILGTDSPICSDGRSRYYRPDYVYPNGSRIVLGGLDNVDNYMSAEYDMICVFEATQATKLQYEKLTTRLRSHKVPYQQIISECNPSYPSHWLNVRFNSGGIRIKTNHEDNPTVTDDYLNKLKSLTGVAYRRLYLGEWCAQDGCVFPEFDRSRHVLKILPEDWKDYDRLRVIDFGFRDPFVCSWFGYKDDVLILYRCIYHTGWRIDQNAKLVNQFSKGESYSITLSDHDADNRAILEKYGIYTQLAPKALDTGLQLIRRRLADGKLFILENHLVTNDPTLKRSGRPTGPIEEFESYVWDETREDRIKETPRDRDNHFIDTLRYACNWLGNPNTPSIVLLGDTVDSEEDEDVQEFTEEMQNNWMDDMYWIPVRF